MDDESPPAKAEAQVRRPLRIPKSKAKGLTVNAISKSMTPLTKSLNWGWGRITSTLGKDATSCITATFSGRGVYKTGATFVLSMEGFFLIFHRVARKSSSTLERIVTVTDGEIRKRKYSPIAKKRRTWAI